MCELCNLENGTEELMMEADAEVTLSGNVCPMGVMNTSIRKDTDGYLWLVARYIPDDEPIVENRIKLDYCPFCGEELKHHAKRILPWSRSPEE